MATIANTSPASQSVISSLTFDATMLSPSDSHARFAFPPELQASSSTDTASDDGSLRKDGFHSRAIVPYYAKPQGHKSAPSTPPAFQQPVQELTMPQPPKSHRRRLMHMPKGLQRLTPLHSTHQDTSLLSKEKIGISPKRTAMKKHRKRNASAGAVAGMVAGIPLGPAGVIVGAVAGAVATNKICKARERRAQRRFEQENFQAAAEQSNLAQAGAFV